MGSLSDVRDMNGNCDGVLADAMIGVRYFTNLTRIDANGTLACSAMPLAQGLNVKDYAMFQAGAEDRRHDWSSNELTSRVTGQPVIGAMLALHKPDGSFDGTRGDLAGCALDRLHDARRQRCPRARWWRSMTATAR